MRIRRKKHLDERLNKLNNLLLSDFDILDVNKAVLDKRYLNIKQIFGNDNPVCIEIGCGKGGFIAEMAKLHPEYNFIAVELLSNIIVMAAENAEKQGLKNLIFFNCGADYLARYILPNSITNIYLNFSPPFPGDRYMNRRLTKDSLINNYLTFLTDNGAVYQKTDDKEFFEYSYSQFKKFNFSVQDVTNNVYNRLIENVETEYEKKFKGLSMPIYYLIANKNASKS